MRLSLATMAEATGDLLGLEIIERKGRGHPDTICDSVAEAVSVALSRHYLEAFGAVQHYNVDKALLWAGSAEPAFGGGRVTAPVELLLAGRGTAQAGGIEVDLPQIVEAAAREWLAANVPLLAPADLLVHALVRPTSAQLGRVFARAQAGARLANDSSVGTGYAPLSRLERLVIDAEDALTKAAAADRPEIGPDTKILAVREGRAVRLTVACAFIDRYLQGPGDYLAAKAYVADRVGALARSSGYQATVAVNAADEPEQESFYLTVTGTSAEAGDDGQAGRGNRVNGLITPFRAMTIESAAGKNAVTHVGKLYNIAAGLIAERVSGLDGVLEAECVLVSAIGEPVCSPQTASLRLRLAPGSEAEDWKPDLERIVEEELAGLEQAGRLLASGVLRIGAWPLRGGDSPSAGEATAVDRQAGSE